MGKKSRNIKKAKQALKKEISIYKSGMIFEYLGDYNRFKEAAELYYK